MTIQELSKYHDIKTEIKQLEDTIYELETTTIGASKMTGMPKSTGGNDNPTERVGIKLAHLKTKLVNKQEKLLNEAHKIEDFLEMVDDSEIRIIIRERFLNGKTWDEVGKKLIADRSTPYYKLKNYLKNCSKEVVNK